MRMVYTEHKDADSFLSVAQAALERHESANGLMLGICLRLARTPVELDLDSLLTSEWREGEPW